MLSWFKKKRTTVDRIQATDRGQQLLPADTHPGKSQLNTYRVGIKPKQIVSIGRIETVPIPEDLPYAGALHALVKDAVGTGVSIDLKNFYSEEPVELHNFVDSIFYRFVVEDGVSQLVYEVTNRPYCIYREVTYDGTVVRTWRWDAEFGAISSDEEIARRNARRQGTLGI